MNKFLHIGLSTAPNSHSVEMRQAFYKNGWLCEDIAVQSNDLNNKIIQVANDFKPTLIFIQIQDRGISKEAIQALKINSGFIIQWSGDIRHTLPQCYLEYAQFGVDLTCFSNMRDIENMRMFGFNVDWLQIGYSTELYNTTGPVNHQADIVFFGNSFSHFPLSCYRKDMVNELKKTYGNNFKAYGSGMPDGSFMGNQPGEAAVYRGAKIGINLSHFDSDRYSSDRLFRMWGSGVAVLSHNFKGMDEIGETGTDWLRWSDLNELKMQINYWLSQEGESDRKTIANNGHQLALNKYTFFHMGQNILSLYNKYGNK